MMSDGLLPHFFIGVTDRTKLIIRILKDIGIDRAHADAVGLGQIFDRRPIVGFIPRNVQRDARADASELLHLSGVSELFVDQLRGPWLAKSAKARAAVSESPGRCFDR